MAFKRDSGVLKITINNPRMTVEGAVMRNLESDERSPKKYVLFTGIPYANPMLGKKRFQPPEPFQYDPEKHGNPFDATKRIGTKIYSSEGKGTKPEEEDCLFLNVYFPTEPKECTELLPVLVYFHGGGFNKSSGAFVSRTPDSMMMHDLVFVAVNYRLGPFGFLNMQTEDCRGNAGLKDQVLALKWVRDNIDEFGGDPNNVTICGEGSGGSCVNFHLISPVSRGLFHKAIIQSGGIYTPWGFRGYQQELVKHYMKYKSFIKFSPHQIVRELQKAKVEDILEYDRKRTKKDQDLLRSCIMIGPTYETVKSDDAFLPCETPIEELIKQAKPVPLLVGITEQEGNAILKTKWSLEQCKEWLMDDESFKRFVNTCLHWSEYVNNDSLDAIKNLYFPNHEAMEEPEADEGLANLCGDLWFHRFYDSFKLGDGLGESAPMYVYKFNYVTEINPSLRYRNAASGATHKDDVAYLFCSAKTRQKMTPISEDIWEKITTMTSLWASFCKTGVPQSALSDVQWIPHTEENPCYLHIDDDNFGMVYERLNTDRWDFLNNIVVRRENLSESPELFPIATRILSSVQATFQEVFNSLSTLKNIAIGIIDTVSSEIRDTVSSVTCTLEREDSDRSSSTSDITSASNGSSKSEEWVRLRALESPIPLLTLQGPSPEEEGSRPPTLQAPTLPESSEDEKESRMSRLEVPTRRSKRHSPTKSPDSQQKTSKDESSDQKKEKTSLN